MSDSAEKGRFSFNTVVKNPVFLIALGGLALGGSVAAYGLKKHAESLAIKQAGEQELPSLMRAAGLFQIERDIAKILFEQPKKKGKGYLMSNADSLTGYLMRSGSVNLDELAALMTQFRGLYTDLSGLVEKVKKISLEEISFVDHNTQKLVLNQLRAETKANLENLEDALRRRLNQDGYFAEVLNPERLGKYDREKISEIISVSKLSQNAFLAPILLVRHKNGPEFPKITGLAVVEEGVVKAKESDSNTGVSGFFALIDWARKTKTQNLSLARTSNMESLVRSFNSEDEYEFKEDNKIILNVGHPGLFHNPPKILK